jgi:uncharacterized protein (TIGR03437 family)
MRFCKSALLTLSIMGSAAAFAQPAINTGGVVNDASYALAGLPNSAIAQGSIFIVFGSGWAAVTAQPVKAPAFPLPTTAGLDGVTANVTDSTGKVTPVILIWVWNTGSTTASWSSALTGILPSTVATGAANITVSYNGQTSNSASFNVVTSSVGIFAVNGMGTGPGIITDDSKSTRDTVLNPTGLVAKTGDKLTIWATGLGPVTFNETVPPSSTVNLESTVNATVWFGSHQVASSGIKYAGRSGGYPGLDQINVVVPPGVSGCYVPVTVVVGSGAAAISSNFVTTSINTTGGQCTDQFGFSAGDFTTLAKTGSLRLGVLMLEQVNTNVADLGSTTTDFASGYFNTIQASSLGSSGAPFGLVSLDGCYVVNFSGQTVPDLPVLGNGLDAGSTISLTSPGGNVASLTDAAAKGVYLPAGVGLPLGFLSPAGDFTFQGTSGADVGPFTAVVSNAAQLTWTNDNLTTVTRSSGQVINWIGGDPNGFVQILGASSTGGRTGVGGFFVCVAPTSAGTFTIPPPVLDALPSSSTSGFGFLEVGGFTAPVPFAATGLDKAYATTANITDVLLTYQ